FTTPSVFAALFRSSKGNQCSPCPSSLNATASFKFPGLQKTPNTPLMDPNPLSVPSHHHNQNMPISVDPLTERSQTHDKRSEPSKWSTGPMESSGCPSCWCRK